MKKCRTARKDDIPNLDNAAKQEITFIGSKDEYQLMGITSLLFQVNGKCRKVK